jgi:VIT1/CCC1 family predicted Fe2+/Mn2+ transporter
MSPTSSRHARSAVVIASAADVERLSLPDLRHRTISVEVPGLPPEEAARISSRLTRRAHACGCETSSVTTVVAIVGLIAVEFAAGMPGLTWSSIATGLAILIAAAVIGKAIGLAYARARLKAEIGELQARILGLESARTSPIQEFQ